MGAIKELVIEQEWQKYKPKINNNSIIIEIWIIKVLFKFILINTGFKCYFIIVTGRVACKQMVPKDERRSIEEGREKRI